ncbi:MAG: lycopene cyclase family protein [Mycobacteriaceae bacterium]
MHIAVVGLGPAGAVLAHRAVHRGWTVDGYDPACADDGAELPHWRSTYGVRLADLPGWAREAMSFTEVSPDLSVHTPHHRTLDNWDYAMIDRDRTRHTLARGISLHRTRVDDLSPVPLGADVVVDCRGVVDRPGVIRQVAYGVVVPRDAAASAGVGGPEFMDWRPSPDAVPGPPSFLYVQPVDGGLLLEETVLATREPTRGLLGVLEARLHARFPHTDLRSVATDTETVHFPVDRRRRGWYAGVSDGVAVFGATGGLTHPATGYSVAAAAASADRMLDLLEHGPLPRAERLSAAAAFHLRRFGAELIVQADQGVLVRFFDAFFSLPRGLQSGYLAGQGGGRVALTMVSLAVFPSRVLPFLRSIPAALRSMRGATR